MDLLLLRTPDTKPVLRKFKEFAEVVGGDADAHTFIEGFYGGSRAIVSPPPEDTDCDIVLLVASITKFDAALELGWEPPVFDNPSTYDGDGTTFKTYRKGEYNLMVFDDPTEYGAVKAATCIAKHANIKDKAKRYKLFEVARSPWR